MFTQATKFASEGAADSIGRLRASEDQHKGNTQGIAHTRWATHGGATDVNSHPHFDMRNQVAVCHNGTISNYSEIKAQLEEEGVTFRSQTDTEVIAQLIGHLKNQVCMHVRETLPHRLYCMIVCDFDLF